MDEVATSPFLEEPAYSVGAAVAGSKQAFTELMSPLVEEGYRLALSVLDQPANAEDAVQEATLVAWRKLGQLRDPAALRSWYLSIVLRECSKVRRNRGALHSERTEPITLSPENSVIAGLDLRRALSRLHPDDRRALVLYYVLDLSMAEVGQVLGISLPAAKSRVLRAARRIRPGLTELEG